MHEKYNVFNSDQHFMKRLYRSIFCFFLCILLVFNLCSTSSLKVYADDASQKLTFKDYAEAFTVECGKLIALVAAEVFAGVGGDYQQVIDNMVDYEETFLTGKLYITKNSDGSFTYDAELIDLLKQFLEEYKTDNPDDFNEINYKYIQTVTFEELFSTTYDLIQTRFDWYDYDTPDIFLEKYKTYYAANSMTFRDINYSPECPDMIYIKDLYNSVDIRTFDYGEYANNTSYYDIFYVGSQNTSNGSWSFGMYGIDNSYNTSVIDIHTWGYSYNSSTGVTVLGNPGRGNYGVCNGNSQFAVNTLSETDGYIPALSTRDGSYIRWFYTVDDAKYYYMQMRNLKTPTEPYPGGSITINNNTVIYNNPSDDPDDPEDPDDPDDPVNPDTPSDNPSGDSIDYTSYFEMIRNYLSDIKNDIDVTLDFFDIFDEYLGDIRGYTRETYGIVNNIRDLLKANLKDYSSQWDKLFTLMENLPDYSEQWNTLFEKISSLPDYSEQFDTLLDTLSEFPDYSEQLQSIITKLEALPDYTDKLQTLIDKLNALPDYTDKLQTLIDKLNALPDYTEKIQTVIDRLNEMPDYTEKIQTVIDKFDALPDYTDVFDKIYDKVDAIYDLMKLEDALDILNRLLVDYSEAATEVSTVAKGKFPFCIPSVIVSALVLTHVTAVPPKFEIPFKVASLGVNEVVVIDWTSDWWAGCRNVVWYFSLFLALLGFIKLTIRMTKFGGSE